MAWAITLGVSVLYWVKLAPILHSQREYDAAVIIFLCVLVATVALCASILRILFKRTLSGL